MFNAAVFDCVVLLQAAVSRGPAFALLTLAEAGRLELLLSNDILSELRDVLLRTEVQRRFPVLSVEFVEAFLACIRHIGTLIDHVPSRFEFRRDPDDEPYLNLAAHGRAKYLVTAAAIFYTSRKRAMMTQSNSDALVRI